MAFMGMDPDGVRHTGNMLKARAGDATTITASVDQLVNALDWHGPDADLFKGTWWPKHRTDLQTIARDLEGLGQSAINNASEQEQASGR